MPRKRAEPEAPTDVDVGAGDGKRSRRSTGKASPIDKYAGVDLPVEGAPGLTYSLGGPEVGSGEGDRLLRQVEVDEKWLWRCLFYL